MPPKHSPFDSFAPGTGSLPLLVRMPDGERHQVDVSATASVRDLKDSIAANIASWGAASSSAVPASGPAPPSPLPPDWDLDFGGAVLQESATLNDYNIPDAYDHASGLLRTISDSAHADAEKKVEALDKACVLVAGISRGERDMERLISAVFDDDDPIVHDVAAQPSLGAMRRRGRSKIPALDFANLPPAGPLSSAGPRASPRAPPTPSQLMRRLSSSRPDLYNSAAAARAGDAAPPAPGASPEIKRQASWFTEAAAMGAPDAAPPSAGAASGPAENAHGSGALKRGNTWFTDVISAFGNSVEQSKAPGDGDGSSEDYDHDDLGISEDEHPAPKPTSSTPPQPSATSVGKTEPANVLGVKNSAGKTENRDALKSAPTTDKVPETFKAAMSAAEAAAGGRSDRPSSSLASASTAKTGAGNEAAGTTPAKESSHASAGGTDEDKNGPLTSERSGTPSMEPQVIGLNPELTTTEEDTKQPKKRGRKRKHPHLTEEQRKLQRQAQNRESAKLSRIRRKNMTAEYEKRVHTLEGENENLRDTVAALTDRLEILQNLLTISVKNRPVGTGPLAQPIMQSQSTGQQLMQPGSVMAPHTSMPQPQQLTNLNYK